MVRLINSVAQLPPQLDFQPILRSLDTKQSLQAFNANNSTSVSASAPTSISVRINSNKWANFTESYFQFDVTLQHTLAAKVGGIKKSIGSLFRSVTILNNGTQIEQIRERHVLERIIALSSTSPAATSNWNTGYEATATRQQTAAGGAVTAATTYTMQPLSGFLSSQIAVPLWAMGEIEIRLELNTAAEAMINITDNVALTGPDFTISAFKYMCELHELPSSYNQSIQDEIKKGGLPYKLSTYDMLTFNVARNSSESVTIANNAKSVKSIWAVQRAASNLSQTQEEYSFVLDGLATTQLRVGGDHYPLEELPVGAPAWKELVKSFQRQENYSSHYDITGPEYKSTATPGREGGQKWINGFDQEKFCGGSLVCGTDFSENDIVYQLSYDTVPAVTGNRWYFYIYKDMTLTIVPNGDVVVVS